MLRLSTRQRELLAEKFPDVANVAAAVLFFGQFLGDRPFSLGLAAFGVAAWAWFMTLALFFAKEMHE